MGNKMCSAPESDVKKTFELKPPENPKEIIQTFMTQTNQKRKQKLIFDRYKPQIEKVWSVGLSRKVTSRDKEELTKECVICLSKASEMLSRFNLSLSYLGVRTSPKDITSTKNLKKEVLSLYLAKYRESLTNSNYFAPSNEDLFSQNEAVKLKSCSNSDDSIIAEMEKLTDYTAEINILQKYYSSRDAFCKPARAFFNYFFYLYLLRQADLIASLPHPIKNNKSKIKQLNLKMYMGEEIIDEDYQSNIEFVSDVISSFLKESSAKTAASDPNMPSVSDFGLLVNKEQLIDGKLREQKEIEEKEQLKTEGKFDFYEGDYDKLNLLYTGRGTLVKRDKYIYTGFFRNGKKTSMGEMFKVVIKDKHYCYFRGEWQGNKKSGFGLELIVKTVSDRDVFIYRKGIFHEGQFKEGNQVRISKSAKQMWIERYEGNFEEGLYVGEGELYRRYLELDPLRNTFQQKHEFYYNGSFSKDKEQGYGEAKKVFKESKHNYEYKGEFMNGKMNGYGIIEFDKEYHVGRYEGIFKDDKWFSEYGKVFFKSGESYEGFFNNLHMKSEVGLFSHADNTVFFGIFQNDKKNYLGRTINEGKLLFIGPYIDGEKCGKFDAIKYVSQDEYSKSVINVRISFMMASGGDKSRLDTGLVDTSHFKMKKISKSFLFDDNLLIEQLK